MNEPFSSIEIQLVRSSLNLKTDQEIAELIDKSIDAVINKIDELTGGQSGERMEKILLLKQAEAEKLHQEEQMKNNKQHKKILLDEKRKRIERDNEKLAARMHMEAKRKAESQYRTDRRTFKTRPVDLSKMISVKIDAKTTVFVKPGTNIELIRFQYSKKPIIKEED